MPSQTEPVENDASVGEDLLQEVIWTHVNDLGIGGLVPPRVKSANTTGQIGAAAIFGLDIGGILRYSIVNGIDCFDELFVHLQPKGINFGVLDLDLGLVGDDLLAKVSNEGLVQATLVTYAAYL